MVGEVVADGAPAVDATLDRAGGGAYGTDLLGPALRDGGAGVRLAVAVGVGATVREGRGMGGTCRVGPATTISLHGRPG